MGHLRRKASGHILRNAAGHFAANCTGTIGDGGFPPCWPCVSPIPNSMLVTPSGISLNVHDAIAAGSGAFEADFFYTWTPAAINTPFCLTRAVDCEFRGTFPAGTLTKHGEGLSGECVIIDFDVSYSFSVTVYGGDPASLHIAAYLSVSFVPTRARGYVSYPDNGAGGVFTLDDTAFPVYFNVAGGGHCYLFWDTDDGGGANSLQDGFGSRTGGLGEGEVNSSQIADQVFTGASTGPTVACGDAPYDDNSYVAWDGTAIGKGGTITADSSGGC
jgi:hypothetical protein